MSAASDDRPRAAARTPRTDVLADRGRPAGGPPLPGARSLPVEDDNVLVDAHEDRWHWRRRIRRDPGKLFFYRIGVALAGLVLIMLGFVSGPLPGPGGIPLVLLGLAVWSSEFEWAHRLMERFKAQLRRFRTWSRPRQALSWVAFFALCGTCGYLYMLALGVPGWLPNSAEGLLARLPGLP